MEKRNNMKNDSKQEEIIQQAIARAERMVISEERFAKLKALNAPAAVIAHEREIIGKHMGNIASDRLAEQLLPQSRNITAIREARSNYLSSKTFLGLCKARFDDLLTKLAHQTGDLEPFETREEALEALAKAIHSGNQVTIVGTILNILNFIEQDLVYRTEELPPLPPRYIIPFDKSGNLDVGDPPSIM
jgi:hypothetical protein